MALALGVAGCAPSRSVDVRGSGYVAGSVHTLAIPPENDLFSKGGDELTDLIGSALAGHGYTVLNENATAALLAKANLTPSALDTPEGLAALNKAGVGGILRVSSSASRMGGPGMRHVRATVNSTRTTDQICEVDWTNSWSGMPGSTADHVMRKGAESAAEEIADHLAKPLQ